MENLWIGIAAAVALALGFFILFQPIRTFEIQKKCYEWINWRIEPISLAKEIRNTRLMGLFLILFVIVVLVYWFLRK